MDFTRLREYEGEDARVALSSLVGRVGLDSPSLREIARTAHRSPSTLLAWFGSKTELHRRTLLAFGVRWHQCLAEHPIPSDEWSMEHARLRLAFEELARSDAAVAEALDEIIAFERERLVVWVQRYVPARSWSRYEPPRPIERETVDALHAHAVALWDTRRYPDRAEARRTFETTCALILVGAGQLFADRDPLPPVEQTCGAADRPSPPERAFGAYESPWGAEHVSDPDDVPPVRERSFEEATRLPYTIIRPVPPAEDAS